MQAQKNARSVGQAVAHLCKGRWLCTTSSGNHAAERWCHGDTEQSSWPEEEARCRDEADAVVVALSSERLLRQAQVQPSTSGRHPGLTLFPPRSVCYSLLERKLGRQGFAVTDGAPSTTWRGFASNAGLLPPRSLPSKGLTLQDFIQSSLSLQKDDTPTLQAPNIPYLRRDVQASSGKVYFETYGCQMNVSDMETVLSIMEAAGYRERAERVEDADVIFIMTCAIRDNAERKIWQRLGYFKNMKKNWRHDLQSRPEANPDQRPPKVAVLGCMAERLKTKLLESDKLVDVVCGPDAYRDLPRLLSDVDRGQAGVNVMLSLDETYADITPVRICRNSVSAYVSIMRGCDNMCSYCIVPFTRGRERARPLASIVREVGELWEQGVKEVTLLGQNVNSYRDLATLVSPSPLFQEASPPSKFATPQSSFPGPSTGHLNDPHTGSSSPESSPGSFTSHANHPLTAPSSYNQSPGLSTGQYEPTQTQPSSPGLSSGLSSPNPEPKQTTRSSSPGLSPGFKTIYKARSGGLTFAHLLDVLSATFPEMRFRFTSPHPKDFPDELIGLLGDRPNVCKAIHLPAQSGSSSVLGRMRRGYTREAYLALVEKIRREVPGIAISSDMISGFCGETEADHAETLALMDAVRYDMAYMFAYSVREKTHAHRRYQDDVPDDVKKRRLAEVIDAFRRNAVERYRNQVGTRQLVLVEGPNKRNPETELVGTTDGNYKVIFSNQPIADETRGLSSASLLVQPKRGDYVSVLITAAESATLGGRALSRTSLEQWHVSENECTRTQDVEGPMEGFA